MAISASMVRDLREKTSAGMLDCKKALEETNGDFNAAVEWLRVKGLASAAKKSDRLASEGLVTATVVGKTGVLVEVNSETDFVAKNDGFKAFVKNVAEHIAKATPAPADVTALNTQKLANGQTVGENLKETIAKIGENLVLRRFARFDGADLVHSYVHGDGKIGVLVELATTKKGEEAKILANDICLHIAAMNPISLSIEDVPADIVSKEREVLKAKNLEQGKKPEMIDKIVEGQIRKFLAENCLLEQAFVKNPDVNVKGYVQEVAKKTGDTITLKRFVRFELGEGLEKRSNNFAEEVAAQTRSH